MKSIDLFAGAGGLSLGLSRVGIKVVLANELDPSSASTLDHNHPFTKVLTGDVRDINFKEELAKTAHPTVDLVCGGPPCQGFSSAGLRHHCDRRNSLYLEFLRVVADVEPQYVLFENVPGFVHLYNGEAHRSLALKLDEMGYHTTSGIVESADYGLPQLRPRMILIGSRTRQLSFPEPVFGKGRKPHLTLWDAISDLPEIVPGQLRHRYACEPVNAYQRDMRNGAPLVLAHTSVKHCEMMLRRIASVPPGGKVSDIPEDIRPKHCFTNTYGRLRADLPAPTITRNFNTPSSARCIHPTFNRALSVREAARLQGFPDTYAFAGSKRSVKTQIGNAVPSILAAAFGSMFLEDEKQ